MRYEVFNKSEYFRMVGTELNLDVKEAVKHLNTIEGFSKARYKAEYRGYPKMKILTVEASDDIGEKAGWGGCLRKYKGFELIEPMEVIK